MRCFDETTMGIQTGTITLLAGPANSCKSAIMHNIALNVAENNKPVLLFSLMR